jgi:hypothetical protein
MFSSSFRAARIIICLLLMFPFSLSTVAEEAKGLTDISEAKTACLVNHGTELEIVDDVREKLQQWGRWKLVQRPEDADLLLILSDRQIAAGAIGTASGSATAYGSYATGNSVAIAAPLIIQKVFLAAVDRQSGNVFTVVSSERHHVVRKAPAWLVGRLKDQVEKHERRVAGRP